MADSRNYDFSMEKLLRRLDPKLHKCFTDTVFALQYTLSKYKLIFPEFSDHTNLHSMTVVDFCNRLIGSQIDRLNADEIYILLTGCYLLWQILIRGTKKQLSILIGLGAGYLTALLFGKVDLSHLTDEGWFALPKLLPQTPVFRFDAIVSVCIIYLVSATETIGDASALVSGTMHREITSGELSGALAADGFGSALGGLMGVTPVTSYSENVGLTILTGVVNRNVARVGAAIMILCGLFPPIGQFVRSIPNSVIGGVLLIVIGQILVSGFQMIAEAGFTPRNKLIVSLSLAVGIGFTASSEAGIWDSFPVLVQSIFAQNVVSVIFAVAMILNLLLPKLTDQ